MASPKVRMTNDMRADIKKRTLAKTQEPLYKAKRQLQNELAKRMYEMSTSLTVMQLMQNSDVKPYINTFGGGYIHCHVEGIGHISLYYDENTVKPTQYPARVDQHRMNFKGNDAAEITLKWREIQAIEEKIYKGSAALETMLVNATNVRQLAEQWPEGSEFYADYLKEVEKVALPALPVKDVNEALGLVSRETKDETK